MNKHIQPAAFMLKTGLTTNIYYTTFSTNLKQKLYELEELKRGKPFEYNLPTRTLDKMLLSWLPGVVNCSYISKNNDCTKWLLSCEPVDLGKLVGIIKIWLLSEYTEGKYVSDSLKVAAYQVYQSIKEYDFESSGPFHFRLFNEDQTAASSETFRILPLLLVKELTGKDLVLGGVKVKLFHSGDNTLITNPASLCEGRRKHYFSICLSFSVQTVPPSRKPLLVYHLSVRRWVSAPETYWSFKGKDTTVYIRTDQFNLQPITLQVVRDQINWDQKDRLCYDLYQLENQLPDPNMLVKDPALFIKDAPGATVLTFRHDSGMKKHAVKPGLPMLDRIEIYSWLLETLKDFALEAPTAERVSQKIAKLIPIDKVDPCLFRKRIAQAIGGKNLAIEIYYSDGYTIGEKIYQKAKEHFGMVSDLLDSPELVVSIKTKAMAGLSDPLDATGKPLERHEKRITEVKDKCDEVSVSPTACIIVLPGPQSYEKNEDPKTSLRIGFAQTGRLTQFIVPENEEASESHRIESALFDLYRQLGLLLPTNDATKTSEADYTTKACGIWIVNYKKNLYGNTQPFPVFVTTDYISGEVWVECDYLLSKKLRYWQASLEFQKIPGNPAVRKLQKKDACSSIRRKMIELYHIQKEPMLVLVHADGVSRRIWKMMTDGELSRVDRKGKYTLEQIWFDSPDASDGYRFDNRENGIRLMRIRSNQEVPDYLSRNGDSAQIRSVSGVFNWDDVYWSIAPRPGDSLFRNAYRVISKVSRPNLEFKFTDMIEIYPIHLKTSDDPDSWVWLSHKLREAAHQYKGTLRLPLPLHLASKLEEYLG